MRKFEKILSKFFAVGVLISLLGGAFAALGFLAALFIGGEMATNLCVFIHKDYFPVLIRVCAIATACGLVSMYIKKEENI